VLRRFAQIRQVKRARRQLPVCRRLTRNLVFRFVQPRFGITERHGMRRRRDVRWSSQSVANISHLASKGYVALRLDQPFLTQLLSVLRRAWTLGTSPYKLRHPGIITRKLQEIVNYQALCFSVLPPADVGNHFDDRFYD
jgi:hypothetical protein